MGILRDLQFAVRQLRQRKGFALVTILTLTLGIGGTTAVFSVVNNVLLRPLAVSAPDKIALVWNVWKGKKTGGLSAGDFTELQQQFGSAETLAATQTTTFTLEDASAPERVIGERATGGYFRLFGVRPLLGRTFAEAEDEPGKDAVVVLTEQMWRTQYQGDPKIVGRSIVLNGRSLEVVGVMPRDFEVADEQLRFWVPMAFTAQRRTNYDEQPYLVYARLKSGVTFAQANSELQRFAAARSQRFANENGNRGFSVQPLEQAMLSDTKPTLYMLLAAAAFVLLIACVNVGTLQLARARTRRKEMAIRNALGASPTRLAAQLLTESFVIAAIGGLCGLALAYATLGVIVTRAASTIPRIGRASVDGRALLFTVLAVLASTLLSGGWAAARVRFHVTSDDLQSTRSSGEGSIRDRLRGAMVITEVALALILLVSAGLLIRSAAKANNVPLGFEAHNLIAARVNLPAAHYSDPARLRIALHQIEEQTQALPGVQSAALIDRAPLSGGGSNGLIPEGKPYEGQNQVQSALHIVTPRYFETAGTPLLLGRQFNTGDRQGGAQVMIVNQALAQAAFPGENALGKRLSWTKGEWITIIGVVANVHHYGVTELAPPEFYIPLDQAPDVAIGWMAETAELMLRTNADSSTMTSELRDMMKRIDPAAPVYRVQSMEERVAATLQERRFTTGLLASFATLAVFLAGVGIYGVLSYVVTLRTQEIGIRMALGAQRSQVLRMVVADGYVLVLTGTAIGVAAGLAATRLIRSLLFDVSPTDVATFVAGAVVLSALALIASYVPAARAIRIDPVRALRNE